MTMTEGRRPFPGEDGAPFAAGVRRMHGVDDPASDGERAARAGVDYADELEPDPTYGPGAVPVDTRGEDELARLGRLVAPPAPRPTVTDDERGRMVRDCYDAIMAQPWGIDVLTRTLTERTGCDIGEAERLLTAELMRRLKG